MKSTRQWDMACFEDATEAEGALAAALYGTFSNLQEKVLSRGYTLTEGDIELMTEIVHECMASDEDWKEMLIVSHRNIWAEKGETQ